jgi:ATP-dependent protease ClpP protease subunit
MKYFQISGKICAEQYDKFLQFINENDSDISIDLNSDGGEVYIACRMLNIINENIDRITLTHIMSGSCMFYLFYKAKCKKQIVKGSEAMYHLWFMRDVTIDQKKQMPFPDDRARVKAMKHLRFSQQPKEMMTKKERKQFNRSQDVWFSFKRLKEIFPEAQII